MAYTETWSGKISRKMLKKQRIIDETAALSNSCESFRAQYRALLEHFSTEADRMFTDTNPPVISEATIQASLPSTGSASAPQEDTAAQLEDELIEDID